MEDQKDVQTMVAPQGDANGVFTPQLKATAKAKVSTLKSAKGNTIVILKNEFKHELLQKGTEVLQVIGSDFKQLLRDAKITFFGLRAACEAGEVTMEIGIKCTIKGKPYYKYDGESTYIAGENVEGEDGMELHRASVIKFIVSAKGRQIANAEDKLVEARNNFERRNPKAAAAFLYGSLGTVNAAPANDGDDKGLDEEPI